MEIDKERLKDLRGKIMDHVQGCLKKKEASAEEVALALVQCAGLGIAVLASKEDHPLDGVRWGIENFMITMKQQLHEKGIDFSFSTDGLEMANETKH